MSPRLPKLPHHIDRWPWWLSCKVSASEQEGFQFRNSILLKIPRVLGLLHVKSYVGVKRPLLVWCGSVKRGCHLRCHSRHLTVVRGPSQNTPRVASKRDIILTKTKKHIDRMQAERWVFKLGPHTQQISGRTGSRTRILLVPQPRFGYQSTAPHH
ncbi:hypothetical protein AVEN_118400-1 [Araneus ventricosus]|uniref:Uncharacterized protein n=1 Tax=Araneus ventricosus TaxID=182803 RepID=A0A4Y2B535_ARAVE|nr:hypothetical protein AVEN_118400-1 [Araneus ventricosus]